MSTKSDRQILLKTLLNTIYAKILARTISGEDPMEDIMENIPEVQAYLLISSNRYLSPRVAVEARGPDDLLQFSLYELDTDKFRQEICMNCDSFYAIYDMIKNMTYSKVILVNLKQILKSKCWLPLRNSERMEMMLQLVK